MDQLVNDLRYAVRMLLKSPLVTGAAIFSLSLGIGANTAMFSWVQNLLLRPLRVAEPDRLVHLYSTDASGFRASYSFLNYRDERDRNDVFEGLVATRYAPFSFADDGTSERVFGQIVSGNYWRVMRVEAALGRTFTPEEDEVPGRDAVAVLSYGFWQRRYAGDPTVVGRRVSLNGHPFEIVGVLPGSYRYAAASVDADLFAPLTMLDALMPGTDRLSNRGWGFLDVVGRLKPGVGLAEAQAQMSLVARGLAETYPEQNEGRTVLLVPESAALLPAKAQAFAPRLVGILMGVVAFVLLIACANVANLQLARAKAREGEIGVRLALGADRRRLLRQLLTESVLLATVAGIAGLAIAFGLNRALQSISLPVGAPVSVDARLDPGVLGFTAAVTLLAALVFGLAPALRSIRSSPALVGGPSTRVVSSSRLGSILVAAQIAFSLLLLIGAFVFLKSLRAAEDVDPGFDSDRVLLASVDPVLQGYDLDRSRLFYQDLTRGVESVPGVISVALADSVPLQLGSTQWDVAIEGYVPAKNERMNIDYNIVTPGYFETMRVPLLSGRDFGPEDGPDARGALIVNEAMAKRFFPEGDAVGRTVRTGGRDRVIVGVVANTKVYTLGEAPFAYMYFPYEQTPRATGLVLHVRTAGDPLSVVDAVRSEVRALDTHLPLFDVETMNERLAFGLLPSRLSASLLGAFGLLALAMAVIGLYGVTAYGVTRRTREIGLRMALGAGSADVQRMVLARVAIVTAVGSAFGLAGGLALGRIARGLLYGAGSTDAAGFVVATLVVFLAAFAAGYLPARRASTVDPMRALRYE